MAATSAGSPLARHGPGPLVLAMGWFPDQPGGLTRYLRSLTEALADDGGAPPRTLVIGPVAEAHDGVRAVAAPDQPLLLRLVRFARAARQEATGRPLIDSHFALYAFPCLLLPSIRRLPLVVHFHGPWADEFVANGARPGLRIELKRRVERFVYRRADALVVLSDTFGRVLVDEFGVESSRVHVVPPGVDLRTFSPGERHEARHRLGIPASAWMAVTARRLDRRMGLDVLLRAWASVDEPDRLLVVVGDGPELEPLRTLAVELGIERRVRFEGAVSDDRLVTCYRAADVSVVPSVALEGFGLVVLEALACGVPVVGSDLGGLGETLRSMDPGLCVTPGDAAALAARLARAAAARDSLPSPAVCRRFAESFSWTNTARRHREVYCQLVATRGDDRSQ